MSTEIQWQKGKGIAEISIINCFNKPTVCFIKINSSSVCQFVITYALK